MDVSIRKDNPACCGHRITAALEREQQVLDGTRQNHDVVVQQHDKRRIYPCNRGHPPAATTEVGLEPNQVPGRMIADRLFEAAPGEIIGTVVDENQAERDRNVLPQSSKSIQRRVEASVHQHDDGQLGLAVAVCGLGRKPLEIAPGDWHQAIEKRTFRGRSTHA